MCNSIHMNLVFLGGNFADSAPIMLLAAEGYEVVVVFGAICFLGCIFVFLLDNQPKRENGLCWGPRIRVPFHVAEVDYVPQLFSGELLCGTA